MLHYLRIAVTALSLTACVLLVVLWVRSYWYLDVFKVGVSKATAVQGASRGGRFVFVKLPSRVSFLQCTWASLSGAKIDAALAIKAGFVEQTQRNINTLKRQIEIWEGERDTTAMESEIVRLNGLINNSTSMPDERLIAQTLGTAMQTEEQPVSKAILAPSSIANRWGFGGTRFANGWTVICPHWFLVMFSGIVAFAVGVRQSWRFSLRTLLIATTLVAAGLGLIIGTR